VMVPILLFVVFIVIFRIFMGKLQKEINKFGDVGSKLLKDTKAMYDKQHEFRDATDADFAAVDKSYYDDNTDRLIAEGYAVLGNLVDKTIAEIGHASPPIRVLTSPERSTTLGLYNLRVGKRDLRICDITTEFADGTYLMTSNTEGLNKLAPPPEMKQRLHPPGTTVSELLEKHEAERLAMIASSAGVSCVLIHTLADAIASQNRQQILKNAFRSKVGYIDPGEVHDIAAARGADSDVADAVVESIEAAKKREGEGNN